MQADVRQSSTIADTLSRGQNFGMAEPLTTTPAELEDTELQNLGWNEARACAPAQSQQFAHSPILF